MHSFTYIEKYVFKLIEKPKLELKNDRVAIARVTMSSICTSDQHIKHGSMPRLCLASPWAIG